MGDGVLRLVRGDLTDLEVDGLVFYASHDLALGSGFGTAIQVRGGPSIQEEVSALGPRETCDVVVSGAGNLKANHILHAVGPRFREEDMEGKLRRTLERTLEAAEAQGIRTLAFPPMGAGFYGFPLGDCARVMVEEIEAHLNGTSSIEEVIVCVQDSREHEAFSERIAGS